MMADARPGPFELTQRRRYQTTPDRLFAAWTEEAEIIKWFGPKGFGLTAAEIDLRVGGKYKLEMRGPDGTTYHHYGEYCQIVPNERLVFTWILEDQPCEGSQDSHCETLITIDFRPVGGGTELVLHHEALPSEQARDGHDFAWAGSLENLAERFDPALTRGTPS